MIKGVTAHLSFHVRTYQRYAHIPVPGGRPDGALVRILVPPPKENNLHARALSFKYCSRLSLRIANVRTYFLCPVLRRRYDVKVYEEFVIKGNTAVLRCHVPEFVREYVTVTAWLIDETVKISAGFHRGDRYSLFPTGELHVRRVDATDAMSRYQCQTQHRLTGEVVSSPSSRKITVRESFAMSPRIIDSRRQVRADQGRSAQMPCAAQGNPVPSYQWFRKVRGQALPVLQGGRFLHLDGTLVINQGAVLHRKMRMWNESYSISVNVTSLIYFFASVTVSPWPHLATSAPLSVTVLPRGLKVDVGKSATFNCSVSGFPVNGVEWYPQPKTAAARDDPPTLRETFSERTLSPGPSISLKCIAAGRPLPQVTWSLDGLPVPENARFRMGDYVTSEGHVVSFVNISGVRAEDGGLYRCSAGQ
ncbi:hypothetical protein MRX96_036878 [Rhipicephalus microplus]